MEVYIQIYIKEGVMVGRVNVFMKNFGGTILRVSCNCVPSMGSGTLHSSKLILVQSKYKISYLLLESF